jgi:virulence-associated protein VagC
MKAQVKNQGLLIPKKFLRGIQSVEVRWEKSHIVIEPTKTMIDPVFGLGQKPGRSGLKTVSAQHDKHLYGKD